MYFPAFLLLSCIAPLIASQPLELRTGNTPAPPKLTYQFTASITFAKGITGITIPGGTMNAESITGGNITGPAISGTISGGIAYPSIVDGGNFVIPVTDVFGTASDGTPFFIGQVGTSGVAGQYTRLVFNIGGSYQNLAQSFLVGTVAVNAAKTGVTVTGFSLGS